MSYLQHQEAAIILLVWNLTRLRTQLAQVPLKQDHLQPGDNYQSKVYLSAFMRARTKQRKKKMALEESDWCSVPGSSRKTEKKQRGKSEGSINGRG